MLQERSAGAVLFNLRNGKREYLILHYHAGHWDFPKGNVEEGEDELATVRREVREETSIDSIQFVEGFRKKVEYHYRRAGRLVHKQVVFYLAKALSKDVKLSYEHKGYEWASYEDAMKRLTYRNARQIIQEVDSFLSRIGASSP